MHAARPLIGIDKTIGLNMDCFLVVRCAPALSCCVVLVVASIGCSSGITTPSLFEPQKAAEVAMQTYDANKDGQLDASELGECPALKGALRRVDSDGDGAISPEEISQRIEAYRSQSDFIMTSFLLLSNRRPAAGVKATMEFEPFMGDDLAQYSGETDDWGILMPKDDQSQLPAGLMPLGFYRVRISPTKQDDNSIVRGCEIADDVPSIRRIVISLD